MEIGVPGDPGLYFRAGTVEALPASANSVYAMHNLGDRTCVYRDGQWWCSPTALVVEVLGI